MLVLLFCASFKVPNPHMYRVCTVGVRSVELASTAFRALESKLAATRASCCVGMVRELSLFDERRVVIPLPLLTIHGVGMEGCERLLQFSTPFD